MDITTALEKKADKSEIPGGNAIIDWTADQALNYLIHWEI